MRRSLAVLLLLSGTARAKGLVVSPSSVFLAAPAGASVEGRLTLTGTTPEETRVVVSARDFVLDDAGRPVWTSGPQPRGLASRLVTAARIAEVGGRESFPLAFGVTLPEEAEGSYWTALVLQVEPVTRRPAAGEDVDVVTRLIVPVFVTVEGASRGPARLADLVARRLDDGQIGVRVTLENVGSRLVRGVLLFSLEEETPGGTPVEIATGEVRDLLVLPGGSRRLETLLTAPARDVAPIRVRAFLDASGQRPAEALADVAR